MLHESNALKVVSLMLSVASKINANGSSMTNVKTDPPTEIKAGS